MTIGRRKLCVNGKTLPVDLTRSRNAYFFFFFVFFFFFFFFFFSFFFFFFVFFFFFFFFFCFVFVVVCVWVLGVARLRPKSSAYHTHVETRLLESSCRGKGAKVGVYDRYEIVRSSGRAFFRRPPRFKVRRNSLTGPIPRYFTRKRSGLILYRQTRPAPDQIKYCRQVTAPIRWTSPFKSIAASAHPPHFHFCFKTFSCCG